MRQAWRASEGRRHPEANKPDAQAKVVAVLRSRARLVGARKSAPSLSSYVRLAGAISMKRHAALPFILWLSLLVPLYWLPAAAQDAPPSHAQLFSALEARSIGPANMSGRITAV